jgi:hypothetical protein
MNFGESEIIDIGIDTLDDNFGGSNSNFGSGNFGSGVEMFMNSKSLNRSSSSGGGLETVDDIEKELNDLSAGLDDEPIKIDTSEPFSFNRSNDNAFSNNKPSEVKFSNFPSEVKFNNIVEDNVGLGAATKNTSDNSETWDGYKKFNDIPVNPTLDVPKDAPMSRDDLLREKHTYIKKLEYLEKKHRVELSKKYTLESNLNEMKAEYETIVADLEKQNSVQFQTKMLMAFVTGIEYLNKKFDPFDVDLDGWGEGINENVSEYDEVFAELHEKYKSKAKMAPELKLLFMLGGSAVMTHMTNTVFKSSMPGMDDIMRQNPELAHQLTQAAAKSMTEKSPGFGGFMGDLMGSNSKFAPPPQQQQPSRIPQQQSRIRPPAPMATSNRPDIDMSRGGNNMSTMMDDNSVPLNTFGASLDEPTFRPKQQQQTRPEMKGPGDLTDILSGLKTKSVAVKPQAMQPQEPIEKTKRGRKPISERNSLSLDI